MNTERATVTRSRGADACLLAVIVAMMIWAGHRRLRVYFRARPAPPPASETQVR